jgi:hypothetical protein
MNAINRSDTMQLIGRGLFAGVLAMLFAALPANAQDSSINVQCPQTTKLHPDGVGIKCDHLAAGDGMVTMADGYPQYVFSFSRVALPGQGGAPTEVGAYASYVMEQGNLAANAPAPTIVVDEDDELFLSLTNVGMTMRPDLFDPHTVHWHGFPQASSIFDGVPDSSISINMGATLTYYYNAKDAGTYMYHCHVEATEHMQMGMLGNLFVHPRQNKLADGARIYDSFVGAGDFTDVDVAPRGNFPGLDVDVDPDDGTWPNLLAGDIDWNNDTIFNSDGDIDRNGNGIFDISANPANSDFGGTTTAPASNSATHAAGNTYAYNDGDGTTAYDVEYPIQIGSFDPDFHDASLNVQPLPFAGMNDRYFLLNGRGYPDTAVDGALPATDDPVGGSHVSQPVDSRVEAAPGQRILLRISNLNITEFYTLGTTGLPMEVIGLDARLLRDDDGTNMYYKTNSLTLGGGQSADVIIVAPSTPGTYFLYSQNLDRLSNNTQNFGGMMTEIHVVATAL